MEKIIEWIDLIGERKDYEQDQHVGGEVISSHSEHEKTSQTQILILLVIFVIFVIYLFVHIEEFSLFCYRHYYKKMIIIK